MRRKWKFLRFLLLSWVLSFFSRREIVLREIFEKVFKKLLTVNLIKF